MHGPADDPRRIRTREGLRRAFREIVLEKRWSQIRVAEVFTRAGVGRSTFYEHFRNKDDLLRDGLAEPFAPLAAAAAGCADPDELYEAFSHFWVYRRIGAAMLTGGARGLAVRLLTEMIEARLKQPAAKAEATFLAAGLIELLAEWLAGRLGLTSEQFAAETRRLIVSRRDQTG